MPNAKLTILLSGMMAADPHQGGATWSVLQYLLGFRRPGHEVGFIEPLRLAGRAHFVTVGLAMGKPDSGVPTCGVEWLATPQPVVLSHWPVAEGLPHDALTTVGNWRGYGSVEYRGTFYGQKAHSLRQF